VKSVIKPAERLLDALEDENRSMFSIWPEPFKIPEPKSLSLNASNFAADRRSSRRQFVKMAI
jgi:hypothetical protein